jgi:hypothetical protein
VLDELPSLEIAASAVALVLLLRAYRLSRDADGSTLVNRRSRVESARARDLVGIVILAGAVVYAYSVARASAWFLIASGVAVLAQIVGFYLRSRGKPAEPPASPSRPSTGPELEIEEEELLGCPQCGHGTLIELEDPSRLLGGLNALTAVSAVICPSCGSLSGHVEDPTQVPIGSEHGTALRQSPSGEDQEALEDPTEHDG